MNEAIGKVEKISAEEMQKITGSIGGLGMGMPGLF
jgi:DNA-binding protein YbaB